jgi:hypothetical protein
MQRAARAPLAPPGDPLPLARVMPRMRQISRFSNRGIITSGVLLCIAVAVFLAWLLGLLERVGAPS